MPKAAPPSAVCSRRYTAARDSGVRNAKDVLWIVLHCTESTSAEGTAKYFSNPHATGSAHLVVDNGACFRCLRDDQVPWAAPGANTNGFHIEQAGFAHWSEAEWLRHTPMLERAAWKTAAACWRFNVPPVFRAAPQLRARVRGVTTHWECTRCFGGTHHDPGAGWPRQFFMNLVRAFYDEQQV